MNEDELRRPNIKMAAQVILRYEGAPGAQAAKPVFVQSRDNIHTIDMLIIYVLISIQDADRWISGLHKKLLPG